MKTIYAALAAVTVALACVLGSTARDRMPTSFELSATKAEARYIYIVLDTDLPDHAEVRLTISRSYEATSADGPETYSHNYSYEEGQVGQWREARLITDDPAWKDGLRAHQDEMAKLGPSMAFEIDSIDHHITVTAYAFAHKAGERFGRREYPDLLAKVRGMERVGAAEIRVRRPLIGSGDIPKRSMRVSGRALEMGESYRLLGAKTPLMSAPDASGGEDIAGMVYLPTGEVISVIGMMSQSGNPWYHVSLPARGGREGWINSIALLADGARRLPDGTSAPTPAAQPPAYRQEVMTHVIDPCLLAYVDKLGLGAGMTDTAKLATAKNAFQPAQLERMVDELTPSVRGEDVATRMLFYAVGKAKCIEGLGGG